MGRRTAAVLLGALAAAGCASQSKPEYERDGVQYGVTEGVFRGRWWSYYERGVSFQAGKFHAESEADLRAAISGRSTDSWRARTYGLHFVEYFPNRELGVTLYHADRLDEAEQYLTTSLGQIDTDRAHYYLDLVKKAKIARGVVQDAVEPEVAVTLEPQVIIASRDLTFEIDANDDNGVENVQVNGEQLHQRGSKTELKFEKEVTLEEGTHEIEVVAKDLADKEVVKKAEVTVDLTAPTIGVFTPIEPTVTDHGTVILEGATVDKIGVTNVNVEERVVAESPGAPKLEFNTELPLGDGENTFVVAARDVAGNEGRTAVKVFKGDPESLEAKLWLLQQKHPEKLQLAMEGGPALLSVLLSAAEAPGNEIRLKSPKPDQPYRHNKTLRISGEVVTQTKVTSIEINGEPVDPLTGAPKESFNKRLPLAKEVGEDGTTVPFTIRATDEAGQVLEKSFNVAVKPVTLNTRESRMPVAVLAFAGQNIDPAQAELLRVTTEAQMVKQGRFRTLDRTNLQDVLTEQQISAALGNPNEALAIGRLTPAHVFLVADVFPYEGNGLEIKARVINTETTDLVKTLDVFITNKDDRDELTRKCDNLAAQLAATYPRLSGEIVDVRGAGGAQEMIVNWTSDDGVQPGSFMLLVHEDAPWVDEDTGEVLEPGEFIEVGRARIVNVSASNSRATTVERKEEGISLEKGMPAITM